MSAYSKTALILGSITLIAGCIDGSYEPTMPSIPPYEPDVVSSMILTPDSVTLGEGEYAQLVPIFRNQWGRPMPSSATIQYTTTAPSVASVGILGRVVAALPGTAVIRATTIIGKSMLVDSTIVVVQSAETRDRVVLTAMNDGWSPKVAHLAAGGTAQWVGGFIATSGEPVRALYLWKTDDGSQQAEEFDLSNGPVTRTFTAPGSYTYCSNACWDPPEWGTIIVH